MPVDPQIPDDRVLAVHPTSQQALISHALYLCRIDDEQGGLVEIDKLDEDDFGEALLAEARQQCRTATQVADQAEG